MNRLLQPVGLLMLCLFGLFTTPVFSQCTTLGQTPATAFPVCGTKVFQQTTVPFCNTSNLTVPGCTNATYQDKNPFYYKFTCYVSGTLGFVITPNQPNEDYDWQLYDITGKNPNTIFTDPSTVVTGNWSGSSGPTGTSATGVNFIQCASDPSVAFPTFAAMPNLIAGHEYLLMISHYSDTPNGYDLSFTNGGNAVITDPLQPIMQKVTPDCDGTKITLKLNKKIRCTTITASGSEFSLSPAVATVISAVTDSCAFGFDFDEVMLTLSAPLTSNIYELIINNGTDANTLLDICGNEIPQGTRIQFEYIIPQPILADSVGKPACATDSILVYYPKKIRCSTVSPNGGDFTVTGPTPVTVIGATGNCLNDLTDYVVVKFASPILTQGNYILSIDPGIDGSPVFDLCGQPILPQTLSFSTADTVNAGFTFTNAMGCQRDTLAFSHNGANGVNKWNWIFNNGNPVTTQSHTIIWPAKSSNTVQLIVDNGTCRDTSNSNIELDNEVKAIFTMPSIICPEDLLEVKNESEGLIDAWRWNFDVVSTSNLKDPLPFLMPTLNREAYYTVKLVASNNTIGCSDSTRKTLTVLDNCLIAVPTGFTPNNDGLNDFFRPNNAIKADNYEFKVYNRWGQLVFSTNNWQDKWDGRINGELQTTGVYVWMLKYTHRDTGKAIFQKGTVTLIR
ncbi:hypothetical protein CAP36_05230 [Chitinophagaceae bacterium IBVUCB2]|nr:hypothetical protein CAP36_05230 [Chitinophagaceae bacterium IBVUCB2]